MLQWQALLIFLWALFPICSQAGRSESSTPACVRAKEAVVYDLILKKKAKQFKETTIKFDKYTPLLLTGNREGKWVEAQPMDGKFVWVRKKDLTTKIQCLIVRVKKSKLYQGPGSEFGPSETVDRGAVFLDKGGEDGWLQVENTAGLKAWINMDHVWKPTSTMRMSFDNQ